MTEIGLKDWPLNTQRGKMKLELPSYSERKGGGNPVNYDITHRKAHESGG